MDPRALINPPITHCTTINPQLHYFESPSQEIIRTHLKTI